MDFIVMDNRYTPFDVVEGFESMIWTERYNEPGQFQLVAPMSNKRIRNIDTDQLIGKTDSRYCMYVNSIVEDDEKGTITLKGPSIEDVLRWRPAIGTQFNLGSDNIWSWDITGTATAIAVVLARYAIHPDWAYLGNIYYGLTNLTLTNSTGGLGASRTLGVPMGSDTYQLFKSLLDEVGAGFRLWRNYTAFGASENPLFDLYVGTNRSSSLVFSPAIDNLTNVIRTRSTDEMVTTMAWFQDQPKSPQGYQYGFETVDDDAPFARPAGPLGTKAQALSVAGVRGTGSYPSAYDPYIRAQVKGQGRVYKDYVDGKVPADAAGYVYGTDYGLGDQVTMNYNGASSTTRVVEHTTSVDSEGVRTYPTLSPV